MKIYSTSHYSSNYLQLI